MKSCPKCGVRFNWWQRLVGEDKHHVKKCEVPEPDKRDHTHYANCRGCPAECFKDMDVTK